VRLKERRRLVVVLRETPLRLSTLDNLRTLAAEGAVVMPAGQAFLCRVVRCGRSLLGFMAGRVLDLCDVDHDLYRRWAGTLGVARSGVEWGDRV
jgi:flavin prenyltransferase